MADQRALYASMSKMASDSQEAAGRRQRKIIYTLVAIIVFGAFVLKMMSPVPSHNAPVTQTSSH